jgi:hypothetical protein
MSLPGMMEPSPFDPDDPPHPRRPRTGEPAGPLTQADLDWIMQRPIELRTTNPWLCMWNTATEDGIGHFSGHATVQCSVRIADPTKSRYCLEHARKLGVDYYSPAELSEATDREVAGSLTRLVPKAVKTLEDTMDDPDAPPGIRAKAADSVLDRTGYAKGVDVRVDARVAVVDVTGILQERLDSLKAAQLRRAAGPDGAEDVTDETATAASSSLPAPASSAPSRETVAGVILDRNDNHGDDERPLS